MGSFVSNDKTDPNNIMLRRQLLKRAQAEPKNSWNILLSWLFMQQGDFDKALVQEKSLYRRNPGNAERIEEIGRLAYDFDDLETSKQAFEFVRSLEQENGLDPDTRLRADIYLLKI
jgi:tetratricopeptide (TPR) repeat protein